MEKSFDLTRLMKNHEKKHKSRPSQFVSVASGVQKRFESNLKTRRSSRLSVFDSIRNLPRCASPAPVSEAQQKVEHRRQQLEKWKQEKDKKKKEAASQKKKPFIAGVPHAPLKFVPPPPPPVKPSTSGRVTRSQSARSSKQVKEKETLSVSFAPKNASFKPPQLKNVPKVPYVNMVALKPIKTKSKTTISFDPVLPKSIQPSVKEVKQTRSRPQNKTTENKVTQRRPEVKTNNRMARPLLENNTSMFQNSSSSDTDSIRSPRNRKTLPAPVSSAFKSTSTETDSSSHSPAPKAKESPIKTRSRKSLPPDSPILISKTPRKSTAKSPKQFTPKNPVPKSESSSEERLRSPKSLLDAIDVPLTPEQIIEVAKRISPCVTMSRGKDNARKEMKKKLEEGLLDEDTSDIDNIDHFRRQLASELKRMTEMCETWDRVSEQTVLPDTIQECILSAVGQARLLMSQKLQQFASLVERCARPDPCTALVTPADLHGFWDMVFMQIENVDMRFKKLEELRARGWVEEQAVVVPKKKSVKVTKTKPVGGASRLKELIAAARKAKKEELQAAAPAPAEKSFEAGFFSVRSPVRCPTPRPSATPLAKPTLLKAVLSSEAKKTASKNSASFAILRASILSKNMDYEGIGILPQTPIQTHTNATPGRSILKQPDSAKRSTNKAIKVVLFDQSDSEMNTSSDNQPMEKQDEDVKELNVDSTLSLMDVEKEGKGKENSKRKSFRLMRQDATEDRSPVMTRSRRKSSHESKTPQETRTPHESRTLAEKTRRSTRKSKILEDVESNVLEEQTPARSTRRRAVVSTQEIAA